MKGLMQGLLMLSMFRLIRDLVKKLPGFQRNLVNTGGAGVDERADKGAVGVEGGAARRC